MADEFHVSSYGLVVSEPTTVPSMRNSTFVTPDTSLANDAADARRLLAMGFRTIVLGDAPVFGGALTHALADVRAS